MISSGPLQTLSGPEPDPAYSVGAGVQKAGPVGPRVQGPDANAVHYRHPGQLNKPATPTACTRCGLPVLHATVGGFDVAADPWAHTPAGELHARAAGRAVFNAHIDDHRIDLTFRFARHITYAPHLPALAEHQCGQPHPHIDQEKTAEILAALLDRPTIEGDSECPF